MKIMCFEQKDMISALIIDQLIKSVMIKLDSVFDYNAQIVQNEKEKCENNMDIMKEACKHKLGDFLSEFNIADKNYQETIKQLN